MGKLPIMGFQVNGSHAFYTRIAVKIQETLAPVTKCLEKRVRYDNRWFGVIGLGDKNCIIGLKRLYNQKGFVRTTVNKTLLKISRSAV